ncbi:hypothetical protein LEP1GSC005_2777 [Leptospira santarosai str. ST188]|nr:hypothetical protein LEP1GSC071_1749 [Leptospira santarosai str. JET]EMF91361.1 hypothetical protein LEP1GSC005_2777 [Leptospira santarosai str. ST188]EMM78400.1 hypothetical protein LEP1GSC040_0440 [Leptospira santarosai str. 2000030832]EMO70626.1 hypothetical protein LEP1GSC130_3541 [Leptospira santarosai str. 200403458]EMO83752.1 hypothetical protein LEP1GSC070_0700 [Leptospira santarosai str. AIM]EMO97662.1 hypothetical protein LEP1GSC120_0049 [Leptospira santarosai str. 200702252]
MISTILERPKQNEKKRKNLRIFKNFGTSLAYMNARTLELRR